MQWILYHVPFIQLVQIHFILRLSLLLRFQYCNTSGSPLSMYVSRLLLRQKYIFKNIDLEHPFQKRLSKMLMIYSAVCLSVTLHYLNVSNHESGLLLLEAKSLKYFPVCFVGLLV